MPPTIPLRRVTWPRLGVTAVVVSALVAAGAVLTSGPASPPAAALAPSAGAATSSGTTAWLWAGRSLCQRGAAQLGPGLLRRTASGSPVALDLPLTVVTSLSAQPDRLLAVGRDRSCAPAAISSRDQGASWTPLPSLLSATSVSAADGQVTWAVVRGLESVVRRQVHASASAVTQPCPDRVPASRVTTRGRHTWLLCQDDIALHRTVAHTDDGGVTWDVPGDELSDSGLEGVGLVSAFDLHLAPFGWLLKPARRCPAGELRVTDDAADQWRELPCPSSTVPVSQVLAGHLHHTDARAAAGRAGHPHRAGRVG